VPYLREAEQLSGFSPVKSKIGSRANGRSKGARKAPETNEFAQAVRVKVREWAQQKPDEIVVGAASSGKPLTRRQISRHVEQKTAIGQRIVKGWMDAAVRSVFDAKIKK